MGIPNIIKITSILADMNNDMKVIVCSFQTPM